MILVTGANGFLGQVIFSLLKESGISVRATDLGLEKFESNCFYRKADITKVEEIKPVLDNVKTIIHAAGLAHIFSPDASSEGKFRQINEIGTANVAAAASDMGVEHFILISSVSVYGPYTQGMYNENIPCNPIGPYALSKYNAEMRAIEIAQKSGMVLTILRLATLYGDGDPGNVGRLMRMIDRERFLWIGEGNNRKSLLYKGDAARACMAIAKRPASGVSIYNVSAPACTMRDIVDGLSRELGKKPFPVRIPASLAMSTGKFLSCFPYKSLAGLYATIEKWLAEDVYDTSHIERAYGFRTQVDLIEGLKREVRWYRQSQGNRFS